MDEAQEIRAVGSRSNLSVLVAQAGVNRIAFASNGKAMALARTDMSVEVHSEGSLLRTFRLSSQDEKVRPTDRIRGLAFGADGDRLFIASGDRIRCISLGSQAPEWSFAPPRSFGFLVSSPLAISVSARDFVAATFDNGSMGIWSPEGNNVFIRREANAPRSIDFAQDDSLIVGTDGFSLCSWESALGKPRLKKLLRERAYSSVCRSKGDQVAVRTMVSVLVMELQDGKILWEAPTGVGLPLLAYDRRTGHLAVPEEHAVTVFDSSGAELMHKKLPGGAVTSVAFHPTTGSAVVGKSDGTLTFLPLECDTRSVKPSEKNTNQSRP